MRNQEYVIPLHKCDFCEATVECEKAPEQDWICEYIPIDEKFETEGFVCADCQEQYFIVNDDGIAVQVSE